MNSTPIRTHTRPVELLSIRSDIDRVDRQILDLVETRFGLAASTLEVKRRHGLPPTDLGREAEVVRRAAALARERGLDPERVRTIYWGLIELSRGARETGGPDGAR